MQSALVIFLIITHFIKVCWYNYHFIIIIIIINIIYIDIMDNTSYSISNVQKHISTSLQKYKCAFIQNNEAGFNAFLNQLALRLQDYYVYRIAQ